MLNKLQYFLKLKMPFFGSRTLKVKEQGKSSSHRNEYQCQYCKQSKPLSTEYFQSVKGFKYGYSTVCLDCGKPKQKEEEN
jgi:hypothetical protein